VTIAPHVVESLHAEGIEKPHLVQSAGDRGEAPRDRSQEKVTRQNKSNRMLTPSLGEI
jgi:hypothetical protein